MQTAYSRNAEIKIFLCVPDETPRESSRLFNISDMLRKTYIARYCRTLPKEVVCPLQR
jgi:hypothetical protein